MSKLGIDPMHTTSCDLVSAATSLLRLTVYSSICRVLLNNDLFNLEIELTDCRAMPMHNGI